MPFCSVPLGWRVVSCVYTISPWCRSRRWSCHVRTRDGEAEAVGVLLEQAVQVGRLAGTRGPGDDNGTVGFFWKV